MRDPDQAPGPDEDDAELYAFPRAIIDPPPSAAASFANRLATAALGTAMGAAALAALTRQLHALGVPVPALTGGQALRLFLPAGVLVALAAERATLAALATRERYDRATEEADQRRLAEVLTRDGGS